MVLQGVLNAQNETVQSKMTFNINDLYKLFEPDIKKSHKKIFIQNQLTVFVFHYTLTI